MSRAIDVKVCHVVIGILQNEQQEVLIALRVSHKIEPNVWEFPGGKVEPHETLENALIREFQEEIGITILKATSFLKTEKETDEFKLLLHTFRIVNYTGHPHGKENQLIRWVPIDALNNFVFPKANAPIISKLLCMINQI